MRLRPGGTDGHVPVVFVMHGVKRNGETYRDNWVAHAEAGKFLVVVPEFSTQHFPGSRGYNVGNVFETSGARKPVGQWTFSLIEKVFDALRRDHGITAEHYDIFGHSAGAQFVHRMVLFMPGARIRIAIAANAGWYTMVDDRRDMPYGLGGAGIDSVGLRGALTTRLVILLGDRDTDPNDKYLRRTAKAMAQGSHRFERGRNFFSTALKAATAAGMPFAWTQQIVPGVGHDNAGMAVAAAKLVGRDGG